MDFRLALKLKDAGFPQRNNIRAQAFHERKDEYIFAPTLEDLIKACDERMEGLDLKRKFKGVEVYWQAQVVKNTVFVDAEGDTMEEAVANLWIELNKKG